MRTSADFIIITLLLFGLNCQGQEGKFQTSVYDNPKYEIATNCETQYLKKLDEGKVFEQIHSHLISNLTPAHKEYFNKNSALKLLFSQSGDIFLNNKKDFAFIVFDSNNMRISIVLYDELRNQYAELYRGAKVINDLLQKQCYNSGFRTLDYQISGILTYFHKDLLKDYKELFKRELIRIEDIKKDKDFVISHSCNSDIKETNNSVCVSTDQVYNNWECLKYDKTRGAFILYYSQAFAD